MSPWLRIFYLSVLVTAVVGNASALYFPTDPNQRLLLGLLLLPMILWAGTRLEVMEILANQARWASRGRVFRELRSQVVLLLEQVRRLNWIAVDAERGYRDRDEAMREMDAIEDEIRGIITDVRRAAGRSAPIPETNADGVFRPSPSGERRPSPVGERRPGRVGEPEAVR